MDMGTMSEAVCPALIPWNPAAETPIIVNGKPLTRTVCPTTPGFEPKRDCQNEWLNTAIQRQVAGNMVIETGYNANVGTHLQTGLLNFNQVPTAAYQALVARLGVTQAQAVMRSNIDSPAARNAGFTRPFSSFSSTVAQAMRPYPQLRPPLRQRPALDDFRRPRVGLGSLAPSFISNRTRRSLCPVPDRTR